MSGSVPREPSWCVRCLKDGTCEDHRGPDGAPCAYAGRDLYEPSSWVLEVVGGRYAGYDGKDYLCTGYDPRCGFWMDAVDGSRRTNVSERAIGATFHRARKGVTS